MKSNITNAQMTIVQITREELAQTIKQAVEEAIAANAVRKIDDTLLNRAETAEYFGVTLPTINAWEKAGRIKGIRYGSRVYFRKSDLLNAA
ncbi:helix-turn-helix domain-containing protein [Chryseolinea sp. T2]|uniref:helix-turn-helix domain-containing protein n=1 Tax=Chryseolinea sp. T2 TaxID=3129255 RepID=UPI0030780BD7